MSYAEIESYPRLRVEYQVTPLVGGRVCPLEYIASKRTLGVCETSFLKAAHFVFWGYVCEAGNTEINTVEEPGFGYLLFSCQGQGSHYATLNMSGEFWSVSAQNGP